MPAETPILDPSILSQDAQVQPPVPGGTQGPAVYEEATLDPGDPTPTNPQEIPAIAPFDHEPTAPGEVAQQVVDQEDEDENVATVRERLGSVVESDLWQSLEANVPSEADLLPKALREKDMLHLYDAITTLPGFKDSLNPEAFVADAANLHIDLGESGELTYIGHGTGKVVWRWTRDGKSMAVGLEIGSAARPDETPIQIPDDPHMVLLEGTLGYTGEGTKCRVEYSDLRTYARIQATGNHRIRLQEFGEPLPPAQPGSWAEQVRAKARDRAALHIKMGFRGRHDSFPILDANTYDELNHEQHYLGKPGHDDAYVVDIPFSTEPLSKETAPVDDDGEVVQTGLRQRVAGAVGRLSVRSLLGNVRDAALDWAYTKSPALIQRHVPVYRATDRQYAGLGNQHNDSEWTIGFGKGPRKHAEAWVKNRTYDPDNEDTEHLKDADEYVAIRSTLGELKKAGEIRHSGYGTSRKVVVQHSGQGPVRHKVILSNK